MRKSWNVLVQVVAIYDGPLDAVGPLTWRWGMTWRWGNA